MMDKKIKIAVTGGIGSGKSVVSEMIRSLGFDVYSADKIYNDMLSDELFVKNVYDLIGVPNQNGRVVFDKKLVSSIVFSDKEKLSALNRYTHNLVYEKIVDIFNDYPYSKPVFFEVPLLFESGKEKDFDNVIVVLRNKNDRINAVKERGLKTEEVLSRMDSQFDYDNSDLKAHTLIINDCSIEELFKRVKAVVEKIS